MILIWVRNVRIEDVGAMEKLHVKQVRAAKYRPV